MFINPLDQPIEIRPLEIFLAVCNTGSMAAAARELRITQPAVSLAIAEIERKCAAVLFDRSVRPLALTPAGGLLRSRATALIEDARELPALLRETVHGRVPQVRIGLVDSLNRALSVELAQWLSARTAQVSVLAGLTADLAGTLLTRRLDMLIGVDDLEETPGLERYELIREPYVLLLAKGMHPVKTMTDLQRLAARHSFVRFSARSQTGLEINRHMRRLALQPAANVEFDTPYGVAASVARGGGFAITTSLCIHEAGLGSGKLQAVRLPGPRISRTLTLVARSRELGNIPRDLAAAMRAHLQALMARLPAVQA